MAGKPPAFQFYPKDFLSDARCARLSDEEAGIYIRMLSMYWIESQTLPSDLRILAEMLPRTTYAKLKKAWARLSACWVTDGNVLRHERLDLIAKEQREFRQAASEAGRRGAEKRYSKTRVPQDDPITETHRGGLSPSSATASASSSTAAADSLDTSSRATLSPAIQFGMWYLAEAQSAGAVPTHVNDPFAWAYGQLEASEKLLAAYGPEKCRDRALAVFAARRADKLRTKNATVQWLEKYWTLAELDEFMPQASEQPGWLAAAISRGQTA